MITLITGLPGNGKTLYCLSQVKKQAELENRPVFYSGITDLNLDWTEIDPEKWYDCPTGAIVVIDECQRVFRPRTISKDVPEHVSKLETHRHLGIDIYLITQHPLLADSAIRRLVGCHKHVIRAFGTQGATIHEWASCKDTCDKTSGRVDSIKTRWKYDKEAYTYYKSAELHTVKSKIPARLYFLIAAPLLLIAAIVYMYNFTDKQKLKNIENSETQSLASDSSGFSTQQSSKPSYLNKKSEAKQYIYENTPRIDGLTHTAPKYDELTKPTRVPVVAGCILVRPQNSCTCYGDYGLKVAMDPKQCIEIARGGLILDFDPRPSQNLKTASFHNDSKSIN